MWHGQRAGRAARSLPGSCISVVPRSSLPPSRPSAVRSSKDLCHCIQLLTQHAGALVEATTRLPADGTGAELVRASTEAFFSFVEQHRYAWRMLFWDPPADGEIAAIHARIHRHATAAIARLIHRVPTLGLPEGIPRERADEMLARAIKSSNDGLAAWWYEHPEVPREQVVAVAVSLCWRGLGRLTRAAPGHGP